MKIWTLQHKKIYNKIIKNGSYKGSSFNYVKKYWYSEFVDAYKWLNKEMNRSDQTAPIFAWVKKPDFRTSEFKNHENLKDMVLIEMEIDKKDIFATDFMKWHFVLSKMYIPLNVKDGINYEVYLLEKYGKDIIDYKVLSKEDKKVVRQSWKRCLLKKPKNQVTINCINQFDITNVTKFQ